MYLHDLISDVTVIHLPWILGWTVTSVFHYCIMLDEVTCACTSYCTKRLGQSTHKHIHTPTTACNVNMSCIHTNEHVLYVHTRTHIITSRCTAGMKGKGRGRFSTDFSPSQSHSRWPQLCSNPSQSQVMMSSHFFRIWSLICCCCVTRREKQPVLFTWELVSHTQKQAGSQAASPVWELLTETFLLSWCFGIYQASAPSSIIHNLSSVSLYLSVCLSVCVWVRAHVSVCHSVCGHDMLSSDLWGATFPPLLSQNLLLLSASWNMGSSLWIFAGQECDASFMDSVQLIYTEIFYWPELRTASLAV